MSQQSRDMRYGRQGGRIVEWAKGDPTRGLFTKHCRGCGRMMQHVDDFDPICSDCREQPPSLFEVET
jgi:hypothetical protein